MNISIEITGDITPENLEAKVHEHAEQFAQEKIRSWLLAQRVRSFHKAHHPPGICDLLSNQQTNHAFLARNPNTTGLGYLADISSSPDRPLSATELRARVFLKPDRR